MSTNSKLLFLFPALYNHNQSSVLTNPPSPTLPLPLLTQIIQIRTEICVKAGFYLYSFIVYFEEYLIQKYQVNENATLLILI